MFAGGDQAYLRDRQYANGSKLASRARLHSKYTTGPMSFYDFVMGNLDLRPNSDVLEAGCGTGWLWADSTILPPGGVRLTVTDLSPGMVAEAVDRISSAQRLASVTGETADLQRLPFADASFDTVVANHMLYHLPDPLLGVAELARVVRPDGLVFASTNGRRHMREIWEIRAEVFGTPTLDNTVDVFGVETGFPQLRDRFASVHWLQHPDVLRCTDPADVLDYICSVPPGEDATDAQLRHLTQLVKDRFEAEGGVMTITKDSGAFLCRKPLRI